MLQEANRYLRWWQGQIVQVAFLCTERATFLLPCTSSSYSRHESRHVRFHVAKVAHFQISDVRISILGIRQKGFAPRTSLPAAERQLKQHCWHMDAKSSEASTIK